MDRAPSASETSFIKTTRRGAKQAARPRGPAPPTGRAAVSTMSNWGLGSMGEGFSKLSTLAESAAQKAAAVTAEAEAKLVASLNADAEAAGARGGERPGGPARQEGEGLDFTSMPRRELEELCAKRSDKLKQAVQKIRAQQHEHARVQRDYEQLQEIVRADSLSRGGGDDKQAAQAMLDLKDARDHCAILKQQLDERDGTIAQLRAQLQAAGSAAAPDGAGASHAGAGACCEELRAELEAIQAKLQQAQEAASSADAGGEALRRARAEHAAALEDAEKRAAEQVARAEGECQMVQRQLEEAMRLGRDGDARQASVGDAQGESEQMRAEVSQLKHENTELKADLAKEKEKIGKLKVKSQEIVGKFKTQAAEKKELEGALHACDHVRTCAQTACSKNGHFLPRTASVGRYGRCAWRLLKESGVARAPLPPADRPRDARGSTLASSAPALLPTRPPF